MKSDPMESNSTIYRHMRRFLCGCPYCSPHGGENRTRYGKHGRTKPRYKDKIRKAISQKAEAVP